MENQAARAELSSKIKTKHLVWPVIFGLCGILFMFFLELKELRTSTTLLVEFVSIYTPIFLLLAVCFVVLKDGAGMLRLYFLSGKKLSLGALFRIRMLYEFTSAATPSAAGGSTLEMVYINKEGIPFGESTAITIISLFLDELFFVLFFPIIVAILPLESFFSFGSNVLTASMVSIFLLAYCFKLIWVVILFVGIFVKPSSLAWIIKKVFALKFLRKYRIKAYRTAVDIKTCSIRMRHKSFGFWIGNIGLSFLLWLSRFCIVNMLILAFIPSTAEFTSLFENFVILVRQYVLMVIMLVAPTPGGSGFTEVLFDTYLGEFISNGGILLIITALWRLLTYYNYLLAGVVIAPSWIKKNLKRKAKSNPNAVSPNA